MDAHVVQRLFGETGARFDASLAAGTFGRTIECLETVDSTNRVAAERGAAGAPEGTTVVADAQLSGRGRRGRGWVSPPGVNLYCSILLRPCVAPGRLGELPLVAAVAVHRALASIAPAVPLMIKWPNDILAAGGKLAGILCEAAVEGDAVRHAVVGIGINVNCRDFPGEIRGIATSLALATGVEHSRTLVLAAVLDGLEGAYRQWLAAPDLGAFLPSIEEHSALRGLTVAVEGVAGERIGRVEGTSPQGELLLRATGGEALRISSGDVRVVRTIATGSTPRPAAAGMPGGGAGA